MNIRDTVICSNKTYDLLNVASILNRTQKVAEGLQTLFLYRSIWEGLPEQTLKEMKSFSSLPLREERKDALNLEKAVGAEQHLLRMEPFAFEHPFLVARMVSGKDLEQFHSYGFSSKRNFAKGVAAYCISERAQIAGDKQEYSWINTSYKNKITLCSHGDLGVTQIDIRGKAEEILINPPKEGFGLKQDWSPFLVAILKYAEAMRKKNIPLIQNWRETARKVRTSNACGTTIPERAKEESFEAETLFTQGLYPLEAPLFITSDIVASLNENRLEMLCKDENGSVNLWNGKLKMRPFLTYFPHDLHHLLTANYQLFARSTKDMAGIMDYFNSRKSTTNQED